LFCVLCDLLHLLCSIFFPSPRVDWVVGASSVGVLFAGDASEGCECSVAARARAISSPIWIPELPFPQRWRLWLLSDLFWSSLFVGLSSRVIVVSFCVSAVVVVSLVVPALSFCPWSVSSRSLGPLPAGAGLTERVAIEMGADAVATVSARGGGGGGGGEGTLDAVSTLGGGGGGTETSARDMAGLGEDG